MLNKCRLRLDISSINKDNDPIINLFAEDFLTGQKQNYNKEL